MGEIERAPGASKMSGMMGEIVTRGLALKRLKTNILMWARRQRGMMCLFVLLTVMLGCRYRLSKCCQA